MTEIHGRCQCAVCHTARLEDQSKPRTHAEAWLLQTEPRILNEGHYDHDLREEHILRFGYAVLNRATVELLLPYSPLLEVGAGSGYWSHELLQAGANILATDPHPWDPETWTTPERLTGPEAVRKYPERNLLLCWPELDGQWPRRTVENFMGEFILYVGEERNGCTGSPEMFDVLETKYELVRSWEIPNFRIAYDQLQVYRKRRTPATWRRSDPIGGPYPDPDENTPGR